MAILTLVCPPGFHCVDVQQNPAVPQQYLHPAQLIKHILGLKQKYGKSSFRLLYLWYDVLGEAGYQHRQEIEEFKKVTGDDNIAFSAISYQEVIANLAQNHRQDHPAYISYMTERYL